MHYNFFFFTDKSLSEPENTYFIFVEKRLILNVNNSEIINRIKNIIHLYYTFNMLYPNEICQTMEFLVRFFYEIYLPKVRGPKNSSSNLNKINNLIKKINNA